ncbi:HEAT repeat domain-containing protein [Gordonia sp. 852002-51296_SCH5728562-b]|uniref:HEAT repeat domain-containing protein n=1 Tax=Gordonia sp. 852002-51296_SCH5728562-b TaxID=1834101 RepID=UPI0007EB4010|nr:HEAT repeat domain-containing protein [Gordonia sp. 852002-51296_SCH5728562-b]OBA42807.1 hypothetical protein A5766_18515 [Gordonia sp. 852002-51296_SCH5728562-b]
MTQTLIDALSAPDPSIRLRAALAAGTEPDPALVDALVHRSGVESDFFVRDMLTWALTRTPHAATVPRVAAELDSTSAQARSQALHTLSKIGDRSVYQHITGLLHDPDDEVARTAWRTAVALVADDDEDVSDLAAALAAELGRGDREVQRSLSRALSALGEAAIGVLDSASTSGHEAVRIHADATRRLMNDPGGGFADAVEQAKRALTLRGAPVRIDHADR